MHEEVDGVFVRVVVIMGASVWCVPYGGSIHAFPKTKRAGSISPSFLGENCSLASARLGSLTAGKAAAQLTSTVVKFRVK